MATPPVIPNSEFIDEGRRGTRALIAWMNQVTQWVLAIVNEGTWLGPSTSVAAQISNTGSDERNSTGNSNRTPNSIYDAIYPSVTSFDLVASVLDSPSGGTVINSSVYGAYVYNANPSTGIGPNAVGFFAAGISAADNCHTWGINTLLQDATSRTIGAGAGRILIGSELDFNVMSPGTQVIGQSVGGNSLSQPTNANAFIANALGTGFYWTGGFVTFDGTVQYAISFGASGTSGANVAGQLMAFASYDAASTLATHTMQAKSGAMVHSGGVVVGTGALATTATLGFLNIPTCAGVPTGVPVAFTGTIPLVYDTTNLRLYGYVGGAWAIL